MIQNHHPSAHICREARLAIGKRTVRVEFPKLRRPVKIIGFAFRLVDA